MVSRLDVNDYRFGMVIGESFSNQSKTILPNVKDESGHLLPSRQQIVARNLVNPFVPNAPTRIFFKHDTGTGKTALSIRILREYLKIKGIQVYVLGFDNTKEVFIADALRYPELGFVSQMEYNRMQTLLNQFLTTRSVVNYNLYKDYTRFLRLKITGKKGTSVQFYGYQEFANRVGFKDDLVNIDNVVINKAFVASMKNSLIIADEVTNTYNTVSLNSRGMALKYVLDTHKDAIHFICLSATPLNNHPAESIELAKLLNYGDLERTKYFHNEELTNLNGFIELFNGKISTYHLREFHLYPEKVFASNSTQLADIDPKAFAFIKCPISDYHKKALDSVQDLADDNPDNESNMSTYFLRDFVFPSEPGNIESHPPLLTTGDLNRTYGKNIPMAFFNESNIRIISAKYEYFIRDLAEARGKTLIFHPRVQYGAKVIERLLESRGFVFEDSKAVSSTICAICGKYSPAHDKDKTNHAFVPSRFTTMHGEIDKTHFKQMLDRYNAVANTNGELLQHMIGTKIIAVGHDFKAIQHIFALGFPDTYHELLQLWGRAIRTKSHEYLPMHLRKVIIHIYVSTYESPDLTPERYVKKWPTYNHINKIIKIMEDISIDRDLYDSKHNEPPRTGELEYYAAELFDDQIANVYRVIKRLFIARSIWKVEDLLREVKNPPLKTSIDMNKVDDRTVLYVLHKILYSSSSKAYLHSVDRFKKSANIASTLFNFDQFTKYFIKTGVPNVLIYREPFLVLMPINQLTKNISALPIQQRHTTSYNINLSTFEMSKLLSEKDPTIEIFKSYSSAIHESTIRELIANKAKNLTHPLFKLYVKFNIIRHRLGKYEYVKNAVGYTINGEGKTATWTPYNFDRPAYASIVGYYESQTFKLIEISQSKLMADSRDSKLKRNIAGKNKNELDARQFSRGAACITYPQRQLYEIAQMLKLKVENESTVNVCNIIESFLLNQQLTKGDKTTYVLFWGPPT